MDVIFVSFQENSDIIGVKYLNAYISGKGYASSILLVPSGSARDIETAVRYIADNKPKVLGVSAMTYEMDKARDFLAALNRNPREFITVFGGIHATSMPHDCMEIADIVVKGEGEDTLLELLEILITNDKNIKPGSWDLSGVSGIVFKKDGEQVHTPARPPTLKLNDLPFPGHLPEKMNVVHQGDVYPLREPKIYKKYARYRGTFLSVVSSRGCPFSCHYCCNSVFKSLYGKISMRNRTPESVIEEITLEVGTWKKILYINFQDDCFLMNSVEWIERFSELYARDIGIPFIIRTTPRHIKKEKLVPLKKAGLRWVFAGLQTGCDRTNKEVYGRNVTAEEFLKSARLIAELKLCSWYDVILDNPYETETEHLKTIDVLMRIPRPYQLDIFSLDYFPGTELRRRALADNIPIPEPGEKSYTKPEPKMINRYIRMSATLSPFIVRALLRIRKNSLGKGLGMMFHVISLLSEPFIYLWLIWKSNDFKIGRTMKVINAFYQTAISKLFFRKHG